MPQDEKRTQISIKEAARTPLAFTVYFVCVVEGLVLSYGLAIPEGNRTLILIIALAILTFALAAILGTAHFKPEALWGKRFIALNKNLAEKLASDIFDAAEGYIDDPKYKIAQEQAYTDFIEYIRTGTDELPREHREFCNQISGYIEKKLERKLERLEWRRENLELTKGAMET